MNINNWILICFYEFEYMQVRFFILAWWNVHLTNIFNPMLCYSIYSSFLGEGKYEFGVFFFASYSNFRFEMILLNLWLDRQNTFSVAGCVNFQKFKKRSLQLQKCKWIQCRIYQRMCTMCKVERTHIINSDR